MSQPPRGQVGEPSERQIVGVRRPSGIGLRPIGDLRRPVRSRHLGRFQFRQATPRFLSDLGLALEVTGKTVGNCSGDEL